MPFANEHSARLQDPSRYRNFRRENDYFDKGIDAVWGLFGNDEVELQSIRFDASLYTADQAQEWLSNNQYEVLKFEPATEGRNATKTDLSLRMSFSQVPETIREEDRSVEFVAATEVPAQVMDYDRWEFVDEILLMDGVDIPENKQVPFLDSHDRESVDAVLGSMRDFRVEDGQLIGRAYFSKREKAQAAFEDVKDGHITDVSVGYRVTDSVFVPLDEKAVINGREFDGPVKVTKNWSLKEVSLTPIGADPYAKARGATRPENKEPTMDDSRKAQAREEDITENKQEEIPMSETKKPEVQANDDAIRAEAETNARKAEQTRTNGIIDLCETAGCKDLATEMIRAGISIDEAKDRIIKVMAEKRQPVETPVEVVADDRDKFRAAAIDGLSERTRPGSGDKSAGFEDFRHISLLRLAEQCLKRAGVNTSRMPNDQIALKALKMRGEYDIVGSTADFPYILANTANKSLLRSFREENTVYQALARVVPMSDFKQYSFPSMSEAANLEEIKELMPYTEGKFNERREVATLSTYGRRFTISRQVIVNDDLAAMTMVPAKFGAAAARKLDQLVVAIFTGNPAMGDGNNLFDNTNHANNPTAAALSSTSLAAAIKAMATQTGFGEDSAPLNILPKFLFVPWALKSTADILINSMANPEATYSEGVANPFRQYGMMVLASARLDANSAASWYLSADPMSVDTIGIGALNGSLTPMLEEVDQIDVDGRSYHVRMDAVAKALAWEGLLKNDGA